MFLAVPGSRCSLHFVLKCTAVFFEGIVVARIAEYVLILHGNIEDDETAGSWREVDPAFDVLVLTEQKLSLLRVV